MLQKYWKISSYVFNEINEAYSVMSTEWND